MKKITKTQITTIVALLLYCLWELFVFFWSQKEMTPVIRVDLFVIYPILIALIVISIVQFVKERK